MSRDCTPTREESRALAQNNALIPVYREVLADMLTPVRAYSLLCPPDSPRFLLVRVEGGERLARYSFIGYQPGPLDLGEGDPLPALRSVRPRRRCRGFLDSMVAPWVTWATRRPDTSRGFHSRPARRHPCPSRRSSAPRTSPSSTTSRAGSACSRSTGRIARTTPKRSPASTRWNDGWRLA